MADVWFYVTEVLTVGAKLCNFKGKMNKSALEMGYLL